MKRNNCDPEMRGLYRKQGRRRVQRQWTVSAWLASENSGVLNLLKKRTDMSQFVSLVRVPTVFPR